MTLHIDEKDLPGLLRAVQDSDVARFHLVTPDFEVYISRSDDDPVPITAAAPPAAVSAPQPVAQSAAPVANVSEHAAAPAVTGAAEGLVEVTAPMIGIFYCAPEPGADPFVVVGTSIEADATVGLVEAMKLFTAVESGTAGTVEHILVGNGDYVEFGQPLLRLRPRL